MSRGERTRIVCAGRRALVLATLTLTSWFGAFVRSGACSDEIVLRDGTVVVADVVTHDGFDSVEYLRGGGSARVAGNSVVSIEHGDAPPAFRSGIEKSANGDLAGAAADLESVLRAPAVRSWLRIDAGCALGDVLRRVAATDPSRYDAAIAAYSAVLSDLRTRQRPRAWIGRARCYLERASPSDLDAARRDLLALRGEAAANGYLPSVALLSEYTLALALLDAGASEAKANFETLRAHAREALRDLDESRATDPADAMQAIEIAAIRRFDGLARVGAIRTELRADDPLGVGSRLEAIAIDGSEMLEVRAAALLGAGKAHLARNERKEAQLAFARVRVEFHAARDALAEATLELGIVAKELGDAEPDGSQLAREYFDEVLARHPDSRAAVVAARLR